MSDLALRLRNRAKECRKLATEERNVSEREGLTRTADELEEVADLMDAEIESIKAPELEGDSPTISFEPQTPS